MKWIYNNNKRCFVNNKRCLIWLTLHWLWYDSNIARKDSIMEFRNTSDARVETRGVTKKIKINKEIKEEVF